MKKIAWICGVLALLLALSACAGSAPSDIEPEPTATPTASPVPEKVLVVYFSRKGEMPEVGVVKKGSTRLLAEMIASRFYSDLYEIQPAEEDRYPETLEELSAVALDEQENKARPALRGDLPDLRGYQTVFIGAPIWYGDWPMILYTFLEGVDLSGKRVIPFATGEGSGISAIRRGLALSFPGSTVEGGLALLGHVIQECPEEAEATLDRYLRDLGFDMD